MDLVKLENKLIAVARDNKPGEQVPYAFEKRVMALLRDRPVEDQWALWARALWRAAAPCVAITMLLATWSLLDPADPQATDLSQDFENTVLAAAVQESIADPAW
jgi:hypothetical protein